MPGKSQIQNDEDLVLDAEAFRQVVDDIAEDLTGGTSIVQYYHDAVEREAEARRRLEAFPSLTAENAADYAQAYLAQMDAARKLTAVRDAAAGGDTLTQEELLSALSEEEKEAYSRRVYDSVRFQLQNGYYENHKEEKRASLEEWNAKDLSFLEEQFQKYVSPKDRERARKIAFTQSENFEDILRRAYEDLSEKRKAEVDKKAEGLPDVGRDRTDDDNKNYARFASGVNLYGLVRDSDMEEAERQRRMDALLDNEDLLITGADAAFSDATKIESQMQSVAEAFEKRLAEQDAEKYKKEGQLAYLDFRDNLIIPDRPKTLVGIPDAPPLDEKSKKAIVALLGKMRSVLGVGAGEAVRAEQGGKEYAFSKLREALDAYNKAIESEDSTHIVELREAADREMKNAREMIRIAKENFGQNPWNIPGNIGLERDYAKWPYEIIKEATAVHQVNGVYSLFVLMQESGAESPEDFMDNLTKYARDVHYKRAQERSADAALERKRRKDGNKGFSDVMDLLMEVPQEYEERFSGFAAEAQVRWTWSLRRIIPDGEKNEALYRYSKNMENLLTDTLNRAKARIGYFTGRFLQTSDEKKHRRVAAETAQNLLAVADEDLRLDDMVAYPGADKDGAMKDPFDLDTYLKSHVPDAAVIKNRLSVMLRRMKEAGTDAALTQNEIADAAMTVCDRAQYAYLKGGGSPEDKRYSELGKLGRELYEKLPEDMRKSADERRLAAGDLRGALFSDSAAEGLGRSLEEANKGVWFGSKEFDAVTEAVKAIGKKHKALLDSALMGEEGKDALRELQESYLEAKRAAKAYINKKIREGKLSVNGQKRMLAVNAAIETLDQERKALDRAIEKLPGKEKSPEKLSEESLRDAESSLPEIGKLLEDATRGVWFGSREFDAVREAVKAIKTGKELQKSREEAGGPSMEEEPESLSCSDLLELRQGYDRAIQAARTYLEKKEAEGGLNKNGEMRLNTMREVLARLEVSRSGIETAKLTANERINDLMRKGVSRLEDAPDTAACVAVREAIERAGSFVKDPENLSAAQRESMEWDLAVSLAVLGGEGDGGIRAEDAIRHADDMVRSGVLADMTGGFDPRACEKMLLNGAEDGGLSLSVPMQKARGVPVPDAGKESEQALNDLREAVKKSKTSAERYRDLLRCGKKLVADACGDMSLTMQQKVVNNRGFQLCMARLAENPKLLAQLLTKGPKEASESMLKNVNTGVRVQSMNDAAGALTALLKNTDPARRLEEFARSVGSVLAVDSALKEPQGGGLMDVVTEDAVRDRRAELLKDAKFKALIVNLIDEGPTVMNAIVKEARGGTIDALQSQMKAVETNAANAEYIKKRTAAYDRSVTEQSQIQYRDKPSVEMKKQ